MLLYHARWHFSIIFEDKRSGQGGVQDGQAGVADMDSGDSGNADAGAEDGGNKDFIFADSSERYLDDWELELCSADELTLARNEIFKHLL